MLHPRIEIAGVLDGEADASMRHRVSETAFIGTVNGEASRKENRIRHGRLFIFVREMFGVQCCTLKTPVGVSKPERPLDTFHTSASPRGFLTVMGCRLRSTKISTLANAGAARPQRAAAMAKARSRTFGITRNKHVRCEASSARPCLRSSPFAPARPYSTAVYGVARRSARRTARRTSRRHGY